MAETMDKVCVLCGRSCAGQPRIKNVKGEYAHRACADKKQTAPAEAAPLHDADDDLMGAFLDDLPAPAQTQDAGDGIRAACPGCGVSMAPGTVVCMSCGFNTRSGKAGKTKVVAGGGASGGAKGLAGLAASAGAAAGSGMATLIGSVIGASIAGALGAAVWAGIIVATNYEIGYVAIGVGLACGFGAAVGSRGNTGMITGLVAVALTLLSISGGKYFAVSHLANEALAEWGDASTMFADMSPDEMRDYAATNFVDTIVEERLGAGGLNEATTTEYQELLDSGLFPDDYPADIVAEARSRWDGMDEPARDAFVSDEIVLINSFRDSMRTYVTEEGFFASFGFMDILFFGIAVVAAFGLGSGGSTD